MDDLTRLLDAARDAYGRRDWPGARERFEAARAVTELAADDLAALADCAWWAGDVEQSIAAGEEAYRRYLRDGRPRQAAMATIGIAVSLFLRGDTTLGAGWMQRGERLLREEPEGAEHGFFLYLLDVESALGGIGPSREDDLEALLASARRVHDLGRRHGDPDLVACGLVGEGRALVKAGRVAEGLGLLDEAMVAVLSDELSPDFAGNAYCHLMSAAYELADVRRAREWTAATESWLQRLPEAVLFTGICRVHRSQVAQIQGAWDVAEREAARVCEDLATIQPASAAEGYYQVGEIRRLRGDLAGAEAAYRQAHRLGRDPQPGLALLRLAQGKVAAAAASIRAALVGEVDDRLARARLCAAQVEIALASGDDEEAGKACDELEDIAATYGSSGLEAMALDARGAVLLAAGRAGEALPVLRDACRRWHGVEAVHACARVRVLLARAYEALGDADAAALERAAAGAVFERLGAADADRVAAGRDRATLPGGLTEREAEVLALVAAGKTNRAVAAELVISEKTVARHLSNIFSKLGLSSRTAAAAYAFEHDLAALVPE